MTIDEADRKIDDLLVKVSAEAKRYMQEYIERTAKNSTKTLSGSIYDEKRGAHTRAVGSALEYASYVNDGRGPVHVKNKRSLHWVYPRPDGKDYFAKEVGPAKGLHFIEKTKEYIESMNITL